MRIVPSVRQVTVQSTDSEFFHAPPHEYSFAWSFEKTVNGTHVVSARKSRFRRTSVYRISNDLRRFLMLMGNRASHRAELTEIFPDVPQSISRQENRISLEQTNDRHEFFDKIQRQNGNTPPVTAFAEEREIRCSARCPKRWICEPPLRSLNKRSHQGYASELVLFVVAIVAPVVELVVVVVVVVVEENKGRHTGLGRNEPPEMAGRTAASRFAGPTATSSSGSNNSPRRSEFQSSPTYATARPMLKATTSGESHFAPGRASPLLTNGTFDHGRVSPSPTHKSLTKAQIEDAIARSKDDGCTLDFSNRELSEIGEMAAEQLSLVRTGEEDDEESCILRCVSTSKNSRVSES